MVLNELKDSLGGLTRMARHDCTVTPWRAWERRRSNPLRACMLARATVTGHRCRCDSSTLAASHAGLAKDSVLAAEFAPYFRQEGEQAKAEGVKKGGRPSKNSNTKPSPSIVMVTCRGCLTSRAAAGLTTIRFGMTCSTCAGPGLSTMRSPRWFGCATRFRVSVRMWSTWSGL